MNAVVEVPEVVVPVAPTHEAPGQGHPGTSIPAEFLSFRVGREEYGIDILRVQEIRSYVAPTRLASAQNTVKGVINLRGVIVPIVDLRLLLGCERAECTVSTIVIVLNLRSRVIGAVVDAVSDVIAFKPEQIESAPQMNSNVDARHITGIACLRSGDTQRMLILLDIEALLHSTAVGSVPF